jgi:hypothetical protein
MNTQQKAKKYTINHPKGELDPLTWDDVREAYIQGSKDMYIKKEHEKIYNASEYLPPRSTSSRSIEVIDVDNEEMVFYEYFQKRWFTVWGDFVDVERWEFGEPVKVEPEKDNNDLKKQVSNMKKYNASEYLPPVDSSKARQTINVMDQDNCLCCYDYDLDSWVDMEGEEIKVITWSYPEPSKTQNQKPWAQRLWEHMSDEHGLTLLDSELIDIVHLVREIDKEEKPEKTAHQLQEELKQAQFEIEEMKNVIKQLNGFRFKANEEYGQLKRAFESLLTNQFSICELRDVWRKRAGLVQKCEE